MDAAEEADEAAKAPTGYAAKAEAAYAASAPSLIAAMPTTTAT